MEQRYARVSAVITTNLDYPSWYEMFGNKPLADALLDRLRHQCITIRIDGPSLREPMPSPEAATPPVTGVAMPGGDQRAKNASRKPA